MKSILKNISIICFIFIFSACSLFQSRPLKNATGNTKDMKKDEVLAYDRMYEGIFINDIDLKDLTREEALEKLKNSIEIKDNFLIKYENYEKNIPISDITFLIEYEKVLDEAFKIGRTGNEDDRLATLENLLTNPKKLVLSVSLNKEKLEEVVTNISKDVETEVVDEKISFSNGKAEVVDGKNGIKVIKTDFLSKFENFDFNFNIDIPVEVAEFKKVDRTLLSSIKGVIGEATTYYDFGDQNRITNLGVAGKQLNEIIIMPNETFSFEKYINNITSENGYKPAATFLNDKVVQSIGGGICQISSTLYQAALKSDMKIVERNQHSLRVYYAPLGLDAMFYEGSSDLKFKNSFDFPVVIISEVGGGAVTFKILGDTTKKNYDVSIYNGGIETIYMPIEEIEDDTMPEGETKVIEKGHNGFRGTSYIKIGSNDAVLLNSDYYKPKKQVVKVGTKKPKTEENSTEEKTPEKEGQ